MHQLVVKKFSTLFDARCNHEVCVTAVKVSNFSGHYLRNHSTLDIGVLGYINIVQHKEHSPEVLSIPPGTPCIIATSGLHVSTPSSHLQALQRTDPRLSKCIMHSGIPSAYKMYCYNNYAIFCKCLGSQSARYT